MVEEVTCAEMKSRLDDLIIVDVVGSEDLLPIFGGGSILHIPLKQLAERVGELDQEAEIVTVCPYGVRSKKAARILRKAGLVRVASLKGGWKGWVKGEL